MKVTITSGDCIERMAAMEAGSVHLVLTGPPYNVGVNYGDGARADRLPDADDIAWTRR